MTTGNPQTMTQTAQLRARDERDSVCWKGLVAGYTIYGRPGYWRIVDTRISVGNKAGGFLKPNKKSKKAASVKSLLNRLYAGTVSFADCRSELSKLINANSFSKEVVS